MNQQAKCVALITIRDPNDHNAWSGTQYRIYQNLLKQFDVVEPLGPVKLNMPERAAIKLSEKMCCAIFKKYNRIHSLVRGYIHARHFSKKLRGNRYSLVFASACSPVVAFLRTDLPIVYLSDATFALVLNYYEEFSQLPGLSVFEGHYAEKNALAKATAVIFSSDWAKQSATKYYGVSAEKIQVCLFGANIDVAPGVEYSTAKLARVGQQCNLLFLARDWQRKGGRVALDAFRALKDDGCAVTLTICGCEPDHLKTEGQEMEGLTVIPYLDKSLESDRSRYHALMSESHFLVLPTVADCTPMVFAEANAYSMPVITSDTGGISSIIKDSVNGYILPVNADGKAYARLIKEIFFINNGDYAKLVRSSRKRYEQVLNWDVWGQCVKRFIDGKL